MKKMEAFEFEVVIIPGPPSFSCKFLINGNDSITLAGDSVEDIFNQCKERIPEGFKIQGIVFSGINQIDSKKNLSAFLSLGFKHGYFKSPPAGDIDNDGESEWSEF